MCSGLTPTHDRAFKIRDVNPVPANPLAYDIATAPLGLVGVCVSLCLMLLVSTVYLSGIHSPMYNILQQSPESRLLMETYFKVWVF